MRNAFEIRSLWSRLWRPFSIWLGSFVFIASLLVCYWGVPLPPLAIAGVATLTITLWRAVRSRSET